jgi:hypothetical protein
LDNLEGDIDNPIDANYAVTDDITDITAVTLAAGKVFTLEFTENGGDIIGDGSTLIVQGKKIEGRAAGDKAIFVGLEGDAVELVQYIRKSGTQARPLSFHCRAVSNVAITISTGLNNGDTLNGTVLAMMTSFCWLIRRFQNRTAYMLLGPSPARHSLFDTYDSLLGTLFEIDEGPTYGNSPSTWVASSSAGGTIDVDDINFGLLVGSMGKQSSDAVYAKFIWSGAYFRAAASAPYSMILNVAGIFTNSRIFTLQMNDDARTLDMSGDLIVAEDASVSGINTGDVNQRETHTLYTDFGPGSPTAGSLVVGGIYTIDVSRVGDDFTNVAHVISGTINTDGCEFIATGTTPSNWSNGTSLITYGEQALTGLIPNSTERIVKRVTMRKASTDISGMGGPFYVGFNAGVAQDVLGTTDPGTISEKMMQLVTTDRVVIAKETSLSHADDGTQVGADNSQSFCGLAGQVLRGIFSDISVGGATVKVDVEYYDVPA